MSRIKKNICLFVIVAMLSLFMGVFFGCNGQNFEYTSSGSGKVITEQDLNGNTVYRAVADDWHTFIGWFDNGNIYSENEVLTLTQSTPNTLEARFSSSALLSADRMLNSYYNMYVDGSEKEGEYFNLASQATLEYQSGEKSGQYHANFDGFIKFNGESQFSITAGDDLTNLFSFFYTDDGNEGNIYFQVGEQKYTFADIGLLTNIFSHLPNPSQIPWRVFDLITNENTRYLINQYFGTKNSMDFVDSVENIEGKTTLVISYNKILNTFKNMAPGLNDEGMNGVFKKVINALTCEYLGVGKTLPEMKLIVEVNYQKNSDKEIINDIVINYNLSGNYKINIDGEVIVIPQTSAKLQLKNISYAFSNQPNSIQDGILDDYPEATINMINVRSEGELNFISESISQEDQTQIVRTVVDKYSIELDADINPFALVSFKKDRENSYNDIEWEKLGFLSFKISLLEDESAEGYSKRHNGTYDYINILLDTKNNGANVYFFVGLYTPETLFSSSYLFNHSYNIPELLNLLENRDDEEASTQANFADVIMKLLTSLVNAGIKIENNEDINQVIFDVFSTIMTNLGIDNSIIENNVILENGEMVVRLHEIRTKIREFEENTIKQQLGLNNTSIKLDKKLFGNDEEDNINLMSIKMTYFSRGEVVKNEENNYLNGKGEVIIDNYNNSHKTLIGISESGVLSELEGQTFELKDINSLVGSDVTATEGLYSDGSVSNTFFNNKKKYVDIVFVVVGVEVKEVDNENNTANVKLLLQIKDSNNALSSIPKLGDVLYQQLGIPYGLIVYNTTLNLA